MSLSSIALSIPQHGKPWYAPRTQAFSEYSLEATVRDIRVIVDLLNKAPPSVQRDVIESYFTSSASMTSPLCRIGSFNGSRWFLIQLYRWYKIVNPQVHVNINSVCECKTSFPVPSILSLTLP